MYPSRVNGYQDPLSWTFSKVLLAPIYELVILYRLSYSTFVAKVKIFITLGDLQAPHVCVIPWIPSKLVQGVLLFAHMSLSVMCLNSQWLQMSLCSLCLLSLRSRVLQILPCIPQTSLQVSILHLRHHSSWTGTLLPFLIGYFSIAGRICINDVTQQCHITWVCLRPLEVSSYYLLFWIISWTAITCSLEQVSSFFSCRWLYMIFPTSQMH